MRDERSQRAYLEPAGTRFQSEPTGTAAAVHSPSLKPGLRRYEGGTHRHSNLRKGEQRLGGGERQRVGGGVSVVGGLRGKKWMGAEPRSTHLVRVGEERFGENSTLKDLSPISVETADKGDDMCTRTPNKQETLTPRRN